MRLKPTVEPNLVWAGVILAAAAEDLLINELYYKLAAEMPRLFLVGLVATGIVTAMALARRFAPKVGWFSRLSVFAALATWLAVVGSSAIHYALGAPALSRGVVIAAGVLLLAGTL